ncbi:MAG: hypothetical protein ACI8RE_003550 [Ilumatobacter sp.]|jgi:hypothetical protein
MTRRYILLAAASIALLAACSGSDGQVHVSGPDPVTAPSITSAPDTTQPEPAPTSPATTESLVAAGPSPAPTSTTGPTPTTPLDPIAEIEAAVKQARLDLEDAYFASVADPANPVFRAAYQGFYTGQAFVPREEFLDNMISDGMSVRLSTAVVKTITFPGFFELIDDHTAILRICRVDSDVLRLTPEGEWPEVIVDDRIVATLTDSRFEFSAGRWLLAGGEQISRLKDSSSCDG